jgi:hypothetical protein
MTLGYFRQPLLTAAQVGATDGTGPWINVQGWTHLVAYFSTDGNPGAGTCVIEEIDDPDTQSALTASAITTVDIDVSVGTDGVFAYHFPVSAYGWIRARIATSVTVATLSVVLRAS